MAITTEFHEGDWVEVDCPGKPWLHGKIGEVVRVYNDTYYAARHVSGVADVDVSATPGYSHTRWMFDQLNLLPRKSAAEVLGDDYFD